MIRFITIIVIASWASAPQEKNDRPTVGSPVPKFEWTRADGTQEPALSEADTVEILLFLRAGQHYSDQIRPEVAAMLAKLKEPKVRIRSIWVASSPAEVPPPTEGAPHLFDPDRRAAAVFGLIAYPTTIVVAPDRKIVSIVVTRPLRYAELVESATLHALGRIDRAEFERRKATGQTTAGTAENAKRATVVARLATRLAQSGRDADAETQFAKALRLAPEAPGVLVPWADYLADRERWDEARPVVALLCGDDAHPSPSARLLLARIALADGHAEEAARSLEELLPMTPRKSRVRHVLGLAYERLERWQDAAEQYRLGLEEALRVIDSESAPPRPEPKG